MDRGYKWAIYKVGDPNGQQAYEDMLKLLGIQNNEK